MLNYLGHVNRNTRTNMITALQGKVDAKRKRGRPSILYVASIIESSGLSLSEVVQTEAETGRNGMQLWLKLGQQTLTALTQQVTGKVILPKNN